MCAVTCEEGEGDVAALFIRTACVALPSWRFGSRVRLYLAFRSRMAFNLELFIQLS